MKPPRLPGARVDTSKPLSFFFDGRPYRGYAGDTLASALLANGVSIVARSFKLHRPRGIVAAGKEEPNALVQLENAGFAEPNARATVQPLYQGLRASGQNAWPGVNRDVFALLGLLKPLMPAAFYYKTLMWPSWRCYAGLVRRMAGLGSAPTVADAQRYAHRNSHCDLLIVGAGPAGLAAALTAAASGKRILLIDEQEEPGGSLLGESIRIDGAPAMDWVRQALSQLAACANVQLLTRTTVSGYYEHNVLAAVERVGNHLGPAAPAHLPRERWWRIRARRVLLATGAIERPLVFANNDRPGVMLAAAVSEYLNRYGVCPWQRAVIATNNDSAYRTALDLARAGVRVQALVDARADGGGTLAAEVAAQGIEVWRGCVVLDAHGRRGLRGVSVARLAATGVESGPRPRRLRCDLLAVSGGWTPSVHLFSQSGGALDFDARNGCFVPAQGVQAVLVAGAANGAMQLAEALREGARKAVDSLRELGVAAQEATLPVPALPGCEPWQALWSTPGVPEASQWVDLQYDVTVADIALAARENFVSVEHLKRYTTAGMSVDQGKTSNVNALAILAAQTGRAIAAVGSTRFRPPYHPVSIGAIAGAAIGGRYAAARESPLHDCHLQAAARVEDYAGWQRPACYPLPGEQEGTTIRREVLAVRNGIGLLDASPLGKIELRGPDAAEFLNRVCVQDVPRLAIGCARYGLMLNDSGTVIDDGVLVRLARDHFLLHTGSAASTRIFLMLEEWLQCEWPGLRVCLANLTTQWATLMLAGPQARELLQRLDSDIDISSAAFPHMRFRSGHIEGVAARVLRASYSGEQSFEISVAARHGADLWRLLLHQGRDLGITPFGVESLLVLRCEKGYPHIGADTDGSSNALDLGWERAIAAKPGDFIGRRSLATEDAMRSDRPCFVGIEPLRPTQALPLGAHVLGADDQMVSEGYVTSACFSPTLGRHIGLGMVRAGAQRLGETVTLFADGKLLQARLVAPAFVDPDGVRLHA